MSIEMPAAEVFGLAHTLTGQAETADDARARLSGPTVSVRTCRGQWSCSSTATGSVPERVGDRTGRE